MKKLIILISLVTISFSADKWEYLIGKFQNTYGFTGFEIDGNKESKYATPLKEHKSQAYAITNSLNLLGEDGWELIDIDVLNDSVTLYIFKRNLTN